MSKRVFSLVILAILGFVGSGVSPAYAAACASATATSATTVTNTAAANMDDLDQVYDPFQFTITSVGNPTIREGEKLRVEARFANKSGASITFDAELNVHKNSFATRSHLLAFSPGTHVTSSENPFIHNDFEPLVSVAKSSKPITVAGGSEQTFVLEVDAAKLQELGWTAQNWGPRGIEVRITSPDSIVYTRTFVVVEPNEGISPMPTGVAVSLTDSLSELNDLYTAKDLTQIRTQPTKRQKNLAELMSMKGVSIFADPAYAHISKAPQTITTASADADVLGLLELDRTDLARSVTSEAFKNGGAPVRVKCLGSTESFAAYAKLGASAFIIDSWHFRTAQNNYGTPATHTLLEDNGESFDVLLNDAQSTQAIELTKDPLLARQDALALSAMTYLEQPAIIRPQLLYFDFENDTIWKVDAQGKVTRDYSHIAEATSALMNAPWVQAAQVSDLLNTPATGSVTLSEEAMKRHFSLLDKKDLDSVDESVKKTTPLASLVEASDSVLAPVNFAATHLYSQNWRGQTNDYAHALNNFSQLSEKYADSVSAVDVSTINLLAEQADIPVRVQNKLDIPATVNVQLDSVDARLTAEKSVDVELPPASTTTVSIPVSARGSGNVQAEIRLHDSQGHNIGTPTTVTVRVRAGWENTATIVFGIAVVLMLVVGIVRSAKRGRRSGPVKPQDYTQARRKEDLAFANNPDRGITPHDSP